MLARAAGGWFSLMMAAIYACIMMLWQWGSTRKHAFFDSHSVPLESFLRMSEQARCRPPLLGAAARPACVHSSAPGQGLYIASAR
jgi:K+ transporter